MCVHTKRAWLHGVSPKGFCSLSLSSVAAVVAWLGWMSGHTWANIGFGIHSQDAITLKVPMYCIYSIFLAQFLLLLLSRHVHALPTHVLGKREELLKAFPPPPPLLVSPFHSGLRLQPALFISPPF